MACSTRHLSSTNICGSCRQTARRGPWSMDTGWSTLAHTMLCHFGTDRQAQPSDGSSATHVVVPLAQLASSNLNVSGSARDLPFLSCLSHKIRDPWRCAERCRCSRRMWWPSSCCAVCKEVRKTSTPIFARVMGSLLRKPSWPDSWRRVHPLSARPMSPASRARRSASSSSRYLPRPTPIGRASWSCCSIVHRALGDEAAPRRAATGGLPESGHCQRHLAV
jgi:hypothetical protein